MKMLHALERAINATARKSNLVTEIIVESGNGADREKCAIQLNCGESYLVRFNLSVDNDRHVTLYDPDLVETIDIVGSSDDGLIRAVSITKRIFRGGHFVDDGDCLVYESPAMPWRRAISRVPQYVQAILDLAAQEGVTPATFNTHSTAEQPA